jgi:hypothetical protein
MGIISVFNPSKDGWHFQNWGEKDDFCIGDCEFSWELYRQTYMGISPSKSIAAPEDLAFYEIFKKCAEQGNCGGLSLLALALFKFGGYMGFCSPASFYSGTKFPAATGDKQWKCTDREDLHRAINTLQARQFSAHGIENFLDVVGSSNLNNADTAFNRAKELLGKGDYPLLSIARDALGDAAHTVIPYNVGQYSDGTRYMEIWDSNHPYDKDPSHYQGSMPGAAHHLVIHSATNWSYTSGSKTYPGGLTGWCFIVPMSTVLNKARQPMAPDMVFDALMTAFVTGPGAAVDQVTDDHGHRLYTFTGEHTLRSDLETDPELRLEGVGRWPWLAQNDEGELPGELYFMRRSLAEKHLELIVRGSQYRLMAGTPGNVLEIEVSSSRPSQDVLRVSRLATAARAIEIQPLERTRDVRVRYTRTGVEGADWRNVEGRTGRLGRSGLSLSLPGDLDAVELRGRGRDVPFDLELSQRREGQVQRRSAGRLSTRRGGAFRVEPDDWRYLDKSDLRRSFKKD